MIFGHSTVSTHSMYFDYMTFLEGSRLAANIFEISELFFKCSILICFYLELNGRFLIFEY